MYSYIFFSTIFIQILIEINGGDCMEISQCFDMRGKAPAIDIKSVYFSLNRIIGSPPSTWNIRIGNNRLIH